MGGLTEVETDHVVANTEKRPLRVIHFPTATSGNSWGLSRGERALGLFSDVLVVGEDRLGYRADRRITFRDSSTRFGVGANYMILAREVVRLLARYDIFHLNFGRSLIDFPEHGRDLLDLSLYARRGQVFMTYNGCDARQRDQTLRQTTLSACHNDDCYGGICLDGRHDETVRRRIELVDAVADGIFALTPDLLRYLPDRAVFLPVTIADWDRLQSCYPDSLPKTLRIAHAPTDRGAKGTHTILAVLEEVQRLYPGRVEVLLIENVSHEEALEMLASAHLLIDQILIGWYGAVAVEAMRMGVPVIAFVRGEDLARVPPAMASDCRRAILSATPGSLFDRIASIIEDPNQLLDLHDHAGVYVERWHDPLKVASITKAIYEEAVA